MVRSVIDPVSRIEGHLRIEMEVENNRVVEAWGIAGLFRGMELVLQGRAPSDAAYISQRICGICPVSHANASSFAAEHAMGIDELPNGARIIRNIIEASQFLHSDILWFYNLTGLDYIDPTNALNADIASTYDLASEVGTSVTDFSAVRQHLQSFIENGQLSIFSGNWFSRDTFSLPAELDLIGTAHYLEGLEYQALASEITAIVGGKTPHVMSQTPGGSTFVPSVEKLDDILFKARRLRDWVYATMIPDTLAIAPYYWRCFEYGVGIERYIAWGVFNDSTFESINRYLPAGVLHNDGSLTDPDESLITEYTGRSYYANNTTLNPRQGETIPEYPANGIDLNGKYTWSKAPQYDGMCFEAGPLSRVLVAYARGVSGIVELVDSALETLNVPGQISLLHSTFGRVLARNLECAYVSDLLVEWIEELIAALAGGESGFFVDPVRTTGEGAGMWEAPRGALYHFMRINNNKISDYQIIIPTTWNLAPRNADGIPGPIEQALVGVPVNDPEKPIDALRTIHSFDPCIACAVHVSEPSTGKHFETVTSPWGVR